MVERLLWWRDCCGENVEGRLWCGDCGGKVVVFGYVQSILELYSSIELWQNVQCNMLNQWYMT